MTTIHTTDGEDDAQLRYAEYVLGVLDAPAHADVEREIGLHPQAAAAVADWERYLLPMAQNISEASVPAHVWPRILTAVQPHAVATPEPPSTRSPPRGRGRDEARASLWDSLSLWRPLGIAATVIVAVLLVVLWRVSTPSVTAPAGYMASTIQQTNGAPGWTVTMDLRASRLIIVPASPQNIPQGRAPELWLIPAGANPIALGVIAPNRPTTLALSASTLARLGPTAALAVSLEPPTGSPTGQPTGAVIGQGAISAAPPGTPPSTV